MIKEEIEKDVIDDGDKRMSSYNICGYCCRVPNEELGKDLLEIMELACDLEVPEGDGSRDIKDWDKLVEMIKQL